MEDAVGRPLRLGHRLPRRRRQPGAARRGRRRRRTRRATTRCRPTACSGGPTQPGERACRQATAAARRRNRAPCGQDAARRPASSRSTATRVLSTVPSALVRLAHPDPAIARRIDHAVRIAQARAAASVSGVSGCGAPPGSCRYSRWSGKLAEVDRAAMDRARAAAVFVDPRAALNGAGVTSCVRHPDVRRTSTLRPPSHGPASIQ